MKYTRNAKIIMFGLMLSILVLIVSWLIIGDLKQTSNTQKFICDIIRENSEYPVDELAEAGCMTEDYLLTL